MSVTKDQRLAKQSELIARIQSDEGHLTAELWELLRPLTVTISRRIVLRSPHGGTLFDTEDILQDAWLALPEALRQYDPERGSFARVYVWCILRASRHTRGAGSRDPLFSAGSLNLPVGDGSDTELGDLIADEAEEEKTAEVERRADFPALQDVLEEIAAQQLSPQQRAAIRLRFYECGGKDGGLSAAQAGERLGVRPQEYRELVSSALRVYRRPANAARLKVFR